MATSRRSSGKPAAKPARKDTGRLTEKQALFVVEYLKDLNATQAAIRAGYSARTAQEQSSRLLSNVMVQKAIAEKKARRAQRTQIDADYVLTRLADLDSADIADILDEEGGIKPIKEWPLVWRRGLVSGIDVVVSGNSEMGFGKVAKIKLADRLKSLEMLGKHIGVNAFQERTKTEVDIAAGGTLAGLLKQIAGAGQRAALPVSSRPADEVDAE